MAAPVIIVLGPPGAGKGTQCILLADRLGAVHLSSGEILRKSKDPLVLDRLASGKLMLVNLFRRAVEEALNQIPDSQPIILDGVGRMRSEVKWLLRQLQQRKRSIKAVINLVVGQNEALKRNAVRGRLDDNAEVQGERWREYNRHMLQTMEVYRQQGLLRDVDGMGSVEEVAERVRRELG